MDGPVELFNSIPQNDRDFAQKHPKLYVWFYYRKFLMESLKRICSQLDEWKRNCLIIIVLTCSIGILSGVVVVAGVIWNYSLVIAGLTIGIFTSTVLIVTRLAKSYYRKRMIDDFNKIVETDQSTSKSLVESRVELLGISETIRNYDNSSKPENIFCAVLITLRTICALLLIFTYFPINEILLSIAGIGIVFDAFNLVMSVQKLGFFWEKDEEHKCLSEFGKKITSFIGLLEQDRKTEFAKILEPKQDEPQNEEANVENTSNDKTTLLSIIDNLLNLVKDTEKSDDDTDLKNAIIRFNEALEGDKREVWQGFLDLDIWPSDAPSSSKQDINLNALPAILTDILRTIQDMKDYMAHVAVREFMKNISEENQKVLRDFMQYNRSLLPDNIHNISGNQITTSDNDVEETDLFIKKGPSNNNN